MGGYIDSEGSIFSRIHNPNRMRINCIFLFLSHLLMVLGVNAGLEKAEASLAENAMAEKSMAEKALTLETVAEKLSSIALFFTKLKNKVFKKAGSNSNDPAGPMWGSDRANNYMAVGSGLLLMYEFFYTEVKIYSNKAGQLLTGSAVKTVHTSMFFTDPCVIATLSDAPASAVTSASQACATRSA